jgi:hypothetical protein
VRAVPRLCELYPGICLTTDEKARRNLSQGSRSLSQGTDYFEIVAKFKYFGTKLTDQILLR